MGRGTHRVQGSGNALVAQSDRWLIATHFVSIVKERHTVTIAGGGFSDGPHAEEGCLTRLRVVSVHVHFYQIVDGCKVSVFGQEGKFLPQRSPREEGNRQGRQGSFGFNSNVLTARLADSGKQLATILFFSVFLGELGELGGSTLPSR